MNESRQLATFVSELKYEHLPAQVIAKAKDCILDQLGCIMSCATLPWSKSIFEYVKEWGECTRESTVAHYGYRTKAENAVFANASFGHGFEIDDRYVPAQSHPGSIVVPAALAMAEKEGISGKDMILAVVAGYEVMGRVNKSVVPSCILRGFHAPTAVSGPFGAATVAGKVLKFDPNLMLNALSIAGSHASGLTEYDQSGGSIKRMHAGMAAHGGLRSAFAARKGITGPATILEGKHGFCQAFADKYNVAELTADLGKDYKVVMGTGFKAYCSCGALHSGIDAMRNLRAKHDLKHEQVAEVTMGTNHQTAGHLAAKLTDIASSQFSAAFGLALTLVRGSNGFKDYTEESLHDPVILGNAQKVKLAVDPECDGEFPTKRAARVTVKLKDGTTYSDKVDYCKGLPENPMTRAEFEGKFLNLAEVVTTKDKAQEILKVVQSLDSAKDISALIKLMAQ
jgi:2-methylcitrate dehydratase PrpD